MALIEVNHQALRNLAGRIDSYCQFQDQQTNQAKTAVAGMLGTDWVGLDAGAFGAQWESVDGPGSVTTRFREGLQDYADALRGCAGVYESAQAEIYNLACLLNNW